MTTAAPGQPMTDAPAAADAPAAIDAPVTPDAPAATAGPGHPGTALDLLFGPAEAATRLLTRQIIAADGERSLGRALERLPAATRAAVVREAVAAAACLLEVDLMDVLVAGWREHREFGSAARRTLAAPGTVELVSLPAHRVTTGHQPSVGILVDGEQAASVLLGLSIVFEVESLVAAVRSGRLEAIHSGLCDIAVALAVHDVEVRTRRLHRLDLHSAIPLPPGISLLPDGHDAGAAPVPPGSARG